MLKKTALKELNLEEAQIKLRDQQEALSNLRFQHSLQQLNDPLVIRNAKREIAQLKTIIREFQLGKRQ
jgi:large subunit ribosomal protein L29